MQREQSICIRFALGAWSRKQLKSLCDNSIDSEQTRMVSIQRLTQTMLSLTEYWRSNSKNILLSLTKSLAVRCENVNYHSPNWFRYLPILAVKYAIENQIRGNAPIIWGNQQQHFHSNHQFHSNHLQFPFYHYCWINGFRISRSTAIACPMDDGCSILKHFTNLGTHLTLRGPQSASR